MNYKKLSLIWIIDENVNDIDKSIQNILSQTYQSIELLCCQVNSYADSNRFIEHQNKLHEWSEISANIKLLSVDENQLLQLVSSYIDGEFVMIINENDKLSVDYCRTLINKMEQTRCDIVIGDVASRYYRPEELCQNSAQEPTYAYSNLDPIRNSDLVLNDTDIQKEYLKHAPYSLSWRCIEGKLIARNLFVRGIKEIVTIDNFFSKELAYTIMISMAQELRNVHDVFYFFDEQALNENYKRKKSKDETWKTVIDRLNEINKCIEQITQMTLGSTIDYNQLINVILIQCKILYQKLIFQYPKKEVKLLFEKLFKDERIYIPVENQFYLDSMQTPIEPIYFEFEKMKTKIANPDIQYVSFDIFDTLILRNLYEPTDLFKILSNDFNRIFKTTTYIDFFTIRHNAENICRKKIFTENPSFEEITLDEIYSTIHSEFGFSLEKLEEVKKREQQLEIEFCVRRKTGYSLYELCLHCGKKVVCTSDMYLPIDTINKILEKNGYTNLVKVFLSSELRLGKYTGNIYPKVLTELKCKENQIIHIGDNWNSDIVQARNNNLEAYHLAKPLDLFCNFNPTIFMGDVRHQIWGRNGCDIDAQCAIDLHLGIRCMAALSINHFFDSPYINYNRESVFNANPYFIGYYVLGSHLWGLAKWLSEEAKEYKRIHFLARDGFLLKQVYDIMHQDELAYPESVYSYMSRYIIPLCDFMKKDDIWALPDKMNVYTSTPRKIVKIFAPIIPVEKMKNIETAFQSKGILYDKKIGSYECFVKVANILLDLIDLNLLASYRKKLNQYFSSVFKPNECFFDVGYNGRVEIALERICGYPIDSFYIHCYKEIAYNREYVSVYKNKCFYDWQPVTTFLIREQLFSKLGASVKGFDFSNDNPELVFGEYETNYHTELITSIIQQGALDFANDFYSIYKNYLPQLHFRNHDASVPMEYYMHRSRCFDRSIFKCTEFEDDFGENARFNLADYWQYNLDIFNMNTDEKAALYNIYPDGLFVKFYNKIDRLMPIGSRKREMVKRVIRLFIK